MRSLCGPLTIDRPLRSQCWTWTSWFREADVLDDEIRAVLTAEGRLLVDPGSLDDEADLYGLGLTSHATVRVMMGLEDRFGVEIPDHLLRKETFRSVASIRQALETLGCS